MPESKHARINIDGMPRMSELLSGLFRQAQLAGQLVGFFGTAPRESDKDFLKRFGMRLPFLNSIAGILETYMPGKFSILPVPVIFNHANWSDSTKLGGYLSIKPSELLASYFGCWQHAAQYPESAAFRFERLAFWYWRERRDPFSVLALLIDLNNAGFFLRLQDFLAAANSVCDAYTLNFDIANFKNHDFDSQSGDDALIRTLKKLSAGSHDGHKAQELVDWVAEGAIDAADRARQVSSADEWVLEKAALRTHVELLSLLDRQHRPLLSATQRVIASQLEEVLADLRGSTLVTGMFASEGQPLLIDLHDFEGVGLLYQQSYGAGWLDKILEERVLAPEALRGHIEAAYADVTPPTVPEIEIPPEWRKVSASIAWPLCAAFDRKPMLERSQDFEPDEVDEACIEMGYSPEPEPSWDKFDSAAQSAARRKLSLNHLSALLEDESLFGAEPAAALEKFEKIAKLYPWNSFVTRELGIRYDQSDNVNEGFRQLHDAILLEPTEAMSWHSMSVVLKRMGEEADAVLAAGIAEMLYEGSPK